MDMRPINAQSRASGEGISLPYLRPYLCSHFHLSANRTKIVQENSEVKSYKPGPSSKSALVFRQPRFIARSHHAGGVIENHPRLYLSLIKGDGRLLTPSDGLPASNQWTSRSALHV